jgi:hypothetical protein
MEAGSAPTPVLIFSLALAFVLVSVPPGLVSLFLITVTDVRLVLHPLVGALFFAVAAGWITQSPGGIVFGGIFGAISLGLSAGLLTARRRGERRPRQRP